MNLQIVTRFKHLPQQLLFVQDAAMRQVCRTNKSCMHLSIFLSVVGDYGKQQIEAGTSYRVTANNNINVAMILKDVYDETRKFFIIVPPHTTSTIQQTVYIPLNTSSIMSEFAGTNMQSYYVLNSSTSSRSARETVPSNMVASHWNIFDSAKYFTVSIVFNAQNQWVVIPGPRHFNRATEQVSNYKFVKRDTSVLLLAMWVYLFLNENKYAVDVQGRNRHEPKGISKWK